MAGLFKPLTSDYEIENRLGVVRRDTENQLTTLSFDFFRISLPLDKTQTKFSDLDQILPVFKQKLEQDIDEQLAKFKQEIVTDCIDHIQNSFEGEVDTVKIFKLGGIEALKDKLQQQSLNLIQSLIKNKHCKISWNVDYDIRNRPFGSSKRLTYNDDDVGGLFADFTLTPESVSLVLHIDYLPKNQHWSDWKTQKIELLKDADLEEWRSYQLYQLINAIQTTVDQAMTTHKIRLTYWSKSRYE